MSKVAIRFDVFALGGDMVDVSVSFIHAPIRPDFKPFVAEAGKLRMSFRDWARFQALRTWGQESPETESEAFLHGNAKGLVFAVVGLPGASGVSMRHVSGRNDCCDECVARSVKPAKPVVEIVVESPTVSARMVDGERVGALWGPSVEGAWFVQRPDLCDGRALRFDDRRSADLYLGTEVAS